MSRNEDIRILAAGELRALVSRLEIPVPDYS